MTSGPTSAPGFLSAPRRLFNRAQWHGSQSVPIRLAAHAATAVVDPVRDPRLPALLFPCAGSAEADCQWPYSGGRLFRTRRNRALLRNQVRYADFGRAGTDDAVLGLRAGSGQLPRGSE